ncbi:hypothetical protein [Treponema sp. C6A8]|uniref:hypothetical protein n=1 Tax=Treponema sp. C6A8 TaxID=1410609 RepID=UPI000484F111|nr:hypothetical protein [Treponema sp. C6A8]
MKKYISVLITLIFGAALFAQNSADVANRATAMRCLKIAENCLVGNDFQNANNQAELGLSYDDSISDLFYIKAAANLRLGNTKASVIKILSEAFEKNNWVEYMETGARILYADLLSDRGDYDKSMEILDSEPFIYSADAEFIRIKNEYRSGTEDSIGRARNKINAARRIYASDLRFMQCFFYFEAAYKLDAIAHNTEYKTPEIVQTIADAYLLHLPDYSGKNQELELMASFFAEGDLKNRLIRAIDAKNMSIQPLLAVAVLYHELYKEEDALNLFFETSGNKINMNLLECMAALVKTDEAKFTLAERLTNIECTILIDEDFDLQNEIEVIYKNGRPESLSYTKHNDGVTDVKAACDLGAVDSLLLSDRVQIGYYEYPEVKEIYVDKDNPKEIYFEFLRKNYNYSLLEMKKHPLLETYGVDFYIPKINVAYEFPGLEDVRKACSRLKFYISEREGGYVVYNMFEGQPVEAVFYEGSKMYATCNFSAGLPFVRFADYDGDGYFETQEIYDLYNPDLNGVSEANKKIITEVFSPIAGSQNLYLKKVRIDRNANKHFEFSEEYEENGDVITLWDSNDDGVTDCKYVKYAAKDGEALKESTVYYDKKGNEIISMDCLDDIPVKLIENQNHELIIYAGKFDEVYWIENQGDEELESKVLDKLGQEFGNEITQGKSFLLQLDENRISVIRVGTKLFFRIIPEQGLVNENEN